MDDRNVLLKFFQNLSDVPISEWAYFLTQIRLQKYKKAETLFKVDEHSDLIGFVVRGLVYTYYLSSSGSLFVKYFAWEGKLISPYVSIIAGKKSSFTAEALSDTTIIYITGETLAKLLKRNVCWERIARKCAESLLMQREKREYESLTMDNLARYESFRNEFQPILDRIPQHIIAGYLGISPISLSRIINKKNT